MSFKHFLLNEDRSYLANRVGDILTASQDLQQDIKNLGSRQIIRMSENIVNQIRKILHSQWKTNQMDYLEELQSVAVMIKKAIDDKNLQGKTYDLKETIKLAIKKLEEISGKIGGTVNKLKAPPVKQEAELSDDDFELTNDQDTTEDQGQVQQNQSQEMPQV